MNDIIRGVLYRPFVNRFLRSAMKPFAAILPEKMKIPVSGVIQIAGNGIVPFKMRTNPTNMASKYLFWGGVEGFEFNSTRIFCELAKDAKVFFDIGANIGYYSLLASSVSKKDIQVFSFEPAPSIYAFLKENCELNSFSNITCERIALSDYQGEELFHSVINAKFKHLPQLTGDGGLGDTYGNHVSKTEFKVQTETLDNYILKHLNGQKIDLIKLDTEATEHKVMKGAIEVLRNHRPIVQCEVLRNMVEHEIEAVLKPLDYLYYRVEESGLVLVNTLAGNATDFFNYYFVPVEKKELLLKFLQH